MKLKDIYSNTNKSPVISLEVFPPKDDATGEKTISLFAELKILANYKPSLVSVTYGAGGVNRNESLDIIKCIKDELNINPMPHFTCVSTSIECIDEYLKNLNDLEIENILALRGDMPLTGEIYNDFMYAQDLVCYIRRNTNLSVAVAGYPEGHKESGNFNLDLAFLKSKIEKGADVVYTQMFFNNDFYYSFVDNCLKIGIEIPIIPGILPIISYKQLAKMSSLCKVELPSRLLQVLDKHQDDADYIKKYGIEFASHQCQNLIENGVLGLHFYTLNKSFSVANILDNLK